MRQTEMIEQWRRRHPQLICAAYMTVLTWVPVTAALHTPAPEFRQERQADGCEESGMEESQDMSENVSGLYAGVAEDGSAPIVASEIGPQGAQAVGAAAFSWDKPRTVIVMKTTPLRQTGSTAGRGDAYTLVRKTATSSELGAAAPGEAANNVGAAENSGGAGGKAAGPAAEEAEYTGATQAMGNTQATGATQATENTQATGATQAAGYIQAAGVMQASGSAQLSENAPGGNAQSGGNAPAGNAQSGGNAPAGNVQSAGNFRTEGIAESASARTAARQTETAVRREAISVSSSGLKVTGYPAELFMLAMAGESSCAEPGIVDGGDKGRAYGILQFDYRYDLTDFMRYAYQLHPQLWPAFADFQHTARGDGSMVHNAAIGQAFADAMAVDRQNAIADQLVFAAHRYWDGCAGRLNRAGFNLGGRSVAVSAAMFSVNVNAGVHTDQYLRMLKPEMTDEEMVCAIYQMRNGLMSDERVLGVTKGTTGRYVGSEPQMALDLLYGYVNIRSNANYGHGVQWRSGVFQ